MWGMQSCPELASEAVDYLDASSGNGGLDGQPAPIVILAVDTTPDSEQLEALKAALVEVQLLFFNMSSAYHVACM
jgi:hypothetical protein